MRKMLVYILVQKLDGFIHRCPPFPLTAGIQQFVHRPDQLPVLLVYRCVSRFQRLRNFISVHLYPPPISTYGDNMISWKQTGFKLLLSLSIPWAGAQLPFTRCRALAVRHPANSVMGRHPARLHSVPIRPKQASLAVRTAVRRLFSGLDAVAVNARSGCKQ